MNTNSTSRLAISETPTTILIVDQKTAKVYTITSSQPNWQPLVEAIKNENNDDEILALASVRHAVETFASNTGAVTVVGNDVLYKNHRLHGLDVDHLLEAMKSGNKRQAKSLMAFLENKQLNVSYKAIDMMYKFRQDRGMPLTEDGCFLAYKGVTNSYWSKNANKDTIVLSGKVDEQGHILNTVGSYIEVDRKCVEDNPDKGCGPGLHAGSLEYATGWGERVVIVKIHPKDVVSVPTAEDNKMRVCAYTVIGECEGKMPEHFEKNLDTDYPEAESSDYEDYEDDDEDIEGDESGEDSGECCCAECQCHSEQDEPEESDEPEDEEVCPDLEEDDMNDYGNGYDRGYSDGRSHGKRAYKVGEETSADGKFNKYISGYNDGYADAHYKKN